MDTTSNDARSNLSICSSFNEELDTSSNEEVLSMPDVVVRGVDRGNDAKLHRNVWLEAIDPIHRYGKHLRIYYNHWESLNKPGSSFFGWLDGTDGDCEEGSNAIPELESLPRSVLDSDVVLYINSEKEAEKYSVSILSIEQWLHIDKHASMECDTTVEKDQKHALDLSYDACSAGRIFVDSENRPIVTGPNGWIFVLRDDTLYAAPKRKRSDRNNGMKRFHHSSFFAGKAVSSAGILFINEKGVLVKLYPHSGHYRPGDNELLRILQYLKKHNINLEAIEVDLQQMYYVSREQAVGEAPPLKVRKTSNLYLHSGTFAENALVHKYRMNENGVLRELRLVLDKTLKAEKC